MTFKVTAYMPYEIPIVVRKVNGLYKEDGMEDFIGVSGKNGVTFFKKDLLQVLKLEEE